MLTKIITGKADLDQFVTESFKAIGAKLGIQIPVRTEGWYELQRTVENAQAQISSAAGISVRFDTSSVTALSLSLPAAVSQILSAAASTPTPSPTPTPAPSFSAQPSISPGYGTAGATTFTATDGTVTNGSIASRRWLLGSTAIGTGNTITPQAAGTLTLENTATGPGGTTMATSSGVTVSAASPTPTPTPDPSSGATPTALPTAPALHYHIPAGSTVTSQTITAQPADVQAATSVSDLRGLANAVNGLGTGPIVMTDRLGRRFLRFTNMSTAYAAANGQTILAADGPNGPNLLQVGPAFSASQRSIAVFMVGRHHRGTSTFFSLGVAGSSPPNTNGGVLRTMLPTGSLTGVLAGANRPGTGASANVAALYTGCQMQVMGVSSRTTTGTGANQGQRLSINLLGGNVAQPSNALSGTGATIGSNSYSPGTADFFDLYEMAVYVGDLSDAQHDAIAAALVANWAIPTVTDQLVLEGDSLTAGVLDSTGASGTGVISGRSLGMLLTEPGAELIPPTCRVVNLGVSGNALTNLLARRDGAPSMYDLGKLSGRNIIALQIGRNDWTVAGASSGADVYQRLTGTGADPAVGLLINSVGSGYLQKGWEVVQAINIATGNTAFQAANDAQRGLLRSAQFLADTQSGAGQTYAGKVSRLELALITGGGVQPFKDGPAIPSDATMYQGNSKTHPTREVGNPLLATGGDTPQYGYGSIL